MRIYRLDVGFWKYPKGSPWKWYQRWFEFSYDLSLCGCHILTIGKLCITWLGDECYLNPKENEESR